jgi:hypothetical protein
MSKPRGTDGSLLASLPWTLSALSLALLPHVQFLPPWITAAFVLTHSCLSLGENRTQ